jgi:hypothetical protein
MANVANLSTTPKNIDTQRILEIRILNALRNGGGGAGGGQATQGAGAPVAAPTNAGSTAFYVDTNTGVLYYWNVANQTWN